MEVARRPKRAIAKVTHSCVTQPVEAAERARCGTLHGMPSSSIFRVILVGCASFVLVACRSESAPEPVRSEPKTETTATPEKPASKTAPTKRTLGVAIADGAGQKAALSDVAKAPAGYLDKKLVTEGTITAVCQHKGCWMEIRDASLGGEAHVKMAGHSFFVPRDASGKKARVLGTLAAAPAGASCGEGAEGHEKGAGCKAEAEKQLGRPLAKLELVAEGVEILD